MKKILFLLILLTACSAETYDPVARATNLDITVLDEDDNDLLDPNSNYSKSIDVENIKIYFVVNGEELLVENKLSDSPKGFMLLEPEADLTQYQIRLFVNTLSKENITETIIQWDSEDRDTIKAEISRTKNSTLVQKIWLNEKLAWDLQGLCRIVIRK